MAQFSIKIWRNFQLVTTDLIYSPTESEVMMNENNDVFTMEDEPIASVVQDMRKGSKWLSAFLESYRPLAGRGTLPDGRRGGGTAPRKPTHIAGIPQQPRVALHTFGREGALPGNGAA